MSDIIKLANQWVQDLDSGVLHEGGADRTKPYFYLAGAMSGLPRFNFPAFHEAAAHLRRKGYNVVNPAELDDEIGRMESFNSSDGDHDALAHVKTYEDCLRRDVPIILDHNCQGIIALPGWEQSHGARLETYNANALGLPIFLFVTEQTGSTLIEIPSRRAALDAAGVIDD